MILIEMNEHFPVNRMLSLAEELSRADTAFELEALLEQYDPINLAEVERASLLTRTDMKFVLSVNQLLEALNRLQRDYRILSVSGRRLNRYRTIYFDTPGFDLYNVHVNGRADRYKVRSREYVDSRRSFLEVKHKTRKDRTVKTRIGIDRPAVQIDPAMRNWLQGVFPYDSQTLQPRLWNSFTRITLVSRLCCERVTVDIDLTFSAGFRFARLEGIAIAEVKQDGTPADSPFISQMRVQHVLPQGFSKYCIGVSLLYDQVKKNALKSKIRRIQKIGYGVILNERTCQISA